MDGLILLDQNVILRAKSLDFEECLRGNFCNETFDEGVFMLDDATLAFASASELVALMRTRMLKLTYRLYNGVLGLFVDGCRCVVRVADDHLLLRRRREAKHCEECEDEDDDRELHGCCCVCCCCWDVDSCV